jgi:heterodisulfide reductase subunit A-like polyferredoxin
MSVKGVEFKDGMKQLQKAALSARQQLLGISLMTTLIETLSVKYDVAVIGLGYVGLTFAIALADLRFDVLGVEKRPEIVNMTRVRTH